MTEQGAIIDGGYRYRHWRTWGPEEPMTFIGLNPSTADATQDDPTIRRLIGYAKREQCGGLVVVNVFALRATNPKELLISGNPIGERNPSFVGAAARRAKVVVVGWGAHKMVSREVLDAVLPEQEVVYWCFGTTKCGNPRHPLYLKKDEYLQVWKRQS